MADDAGAQELLKINQRLLAAADWTTYQELCDPSLTCFEPEAMGQLVEGMRFHEFYFKLGAGTRARNTTIASPRVRMVGDVGIVCYVRINQSVAGDGAPFSQVFEETRIWQKKQGAWKHVHFHRSAPAR